MLLNIASLTFVHVVISLIGIATGFVVLFGLLAGNSLKNWTAAFLVATVATSATGFLFPIAAFTPALGVGVLSMIALAAAIAARYGFHLRGNWRSVYVIGAVLALYLNVFVLIVQMFQKIAPLNALAPTGTEPPFAVAQGLTLILFAYAGFLCVRRFNPRAAAA